MDQKLVPETFALGREFWKAAHTCPGYKLLKNVYLIYSLTARATHKLSKYLISPDVL